MKKIKKYKPKGYYETLAVSYILFSILLIGANILTKDKVFSESENRILTTKPKFTIDRLLEGRFTSKFEDYVVDQFIGRDFFTSIKINMDKLLGKKESNGVFLCNDEYLIENFIKPNEDTVVENLQAINNFANKYKNIKQYMLVSPTAISILKDKLPMYAPVIDQEEYLQSYKEKLSESINFIDNYNILKKHSKEDIFYRTDHHWTSLGARYSYDELVKAMKLKETPNNYYESILVSHDFFGALSSKSGYKLKEGDNVKVFIPSDKNAEAVVVNYVEEQEKTATLYSSEALEQKDNYQVFLKGNHPLVKIKTNAKNNKTLLIFKDSYANSFIPFLVKDFSKIIVVDSRYYYEDIDKLIESENISEVLYLYNANTFFNDTSLSSVLNNE